MGYHKCGDSIYTLYNIIHYIIYCAVTMPEARGTPEECRSENNNSVVFFQSVYSSSSSCASLFFSVRIDVAGAAGDFIPVTRSNLHMSIYPRGGAYYILCYRVANIYIYIIYNSTLIGGGEFFDRWLYTETCIISSSSPVPQRLYTFTYACT